MDISPLPSFLIQQLFLLFVQQPRIMVGSTLALRSKMVSAPAMRLPSASRIQPSSQVLRSTRSLRPNGFQQSFQRSTRRTYADAAAPTPTPAPKPKKRFRFLRWTWRLTWMGTVALVGTVAYSIYDTRNPIDQIQPDPSRKTLVVLGACLSHCDK